ncbi:hypothetical protein [Reinekea blandensis]|uniref:Uncharacterized protein n=1 Tax=Reinekea blandensis MED297 TaxID=314283 RepID=A4BDR2_9GAMM|nr:hypothetical protein [Reinekea blandensis]EAR09671.1 hypothetical protein MED297_15969 [Reinekea blandensis MED297]
MILTLTNAPTVLEHELFQQLLTPEDILMVTDRALMLSIRQNPYPAKGYLLLEDSHSLGGAQHDDWQTLSTNDWVSLVTEHDKQITW